MGFGKDGKGVILRQSISEALLTLANDTAIFITVKPDILERFRMLKSEIIGNVEGLTAGEGRGLSLWLADGDLTLAETEAAIEGAGPLGPNDPVAAAIAERFVMPVGVVGGGQPLAHIHDGHTNGPIVVTKPRWTFSRSKSWNWVLYNMGASLTTGATVNLRVKNFGVWVT